MDMDDVEIRIKYDECIYVKYLNIDTVCASFDLRKFTISLRKLELYLFYNYIYYNYIHI